MFASLSIRAKIISVVAFLLVAMTGMGLLAVMKMRSMNANTTDITKNWMPSVRVLGEIRAGVITYRNVVRQHMLSETLEDKLANEKTAGTVIEALAKARKSYEPMVTSAEERALYNEWAKLWDQYKQGTDEVFALSRKEAGKVPHDAQELNTKTVNKIGLASDEVLTKDIDLNTRGGDQAAQDAADSYFYAFMLVLIILGAAVVIGMAVSFYVVQAVSSGINSIIQPMQALGRGDLSAEVLHRGEKTEIGAMADVLQVFKEALIAKKAADEAAAHDAEAKIERGRRVDNVTREFETMIGEIVETVSSASTQLEVLRLDPDLDRRSLAAAGDHGCRGLGRGLHQRAVGGLRHRRDGLLGRRDQPSGAGIGADGGRGRRPGPRHHRTGQRVVEGGLAHRRRRRADQHHRRPDQPAGAERDHRGGARR